MQTGDIIEFNSSNSPIEIPDGTYRGEVIDTDFQLGSNSMDREWGTVKVIDGNADVIGRELTIYKQL